MDLNLQRKRVLITGSTQGIGRAIAESFLKEGAIVAINGRNEAKLQSVLTELQNLYPQEKVIGICGDALDESFLLKLHQTVELEFKGLDILIPNVGSGKPISQDKLLFDEWERLIHINLFSATKLLHEFVPTLKKGNAPSIVLLSSITAKEHIGAPYAYAAAKSAILTLTKYLARDLAKDNIRVNCVLPGNVLFTGGRWEELLKQDQEGVMEMICTKVPLKRFARPEEIADTVVFLASEKSLFTTGTSVVIDGGQLSSV